MRVGAIIPSGAAKAAGIKTGAIIAAIDGQPCRGMTHTEVVQKLDNVPSGSSIKLDIFPEDPPMKVAEHLMVTMWRQRGQPLGLALRSPPNGIGVFLSASRQPPNTPALLTDVLKSDNLFLVEANGMMLKNSSHDEVGETNNKNNNEEKKKKVKEKNR